MSVASSKRIPWLPALLVVLPWLGGAVLMVASPPPQRVSGCAGPLPGAVLDHLARCDHGATVEASTNEDWPGHHPLFVLDGRAGGEVEKWVSLSRDDHPWLTIHLPRPTLVGRVVLHHAGVQESPESNTRAFSILVKDHGAMREVVAVEGNRENVSSHTFPPVLTDVVTLQVHHGTQGNDARTRLYEVEIHGP